MAAWKKVAFKKNRRLEHFAFGAPSRTAGAVYLIRPFPFLLFIICTSSFTKPERVV
jgi:hypothetical protein